MKSTPTLRFSIQSLFLSTRVSNVALVSVGGRTIKHFFDAFRSLRTFNACLLSLVMLTTPFAPLFASTTGASVITARTDGQPISQRTTTPKPKPNQGDNPLAPAVATVTATLADDIGLGAKKNPGDTITYTAVISNSGTDATGVTYTHNLDANTTQTGTVNVSPVTIDDTYPQTVIGNLSINSALIPYSVVTNDYQGQNGGTPTITAFNATTTNGGQVVMTTSGVDVGKFTYNPPPGFEGTDTFTYTLTNSVGSSIGTVSIPVSGMVWFINNGAGACTTLAAGCGRLSNPFSTLTAFNTLNNGTGNNPAANDNIFIYESVTQYTGAMTLQSAQKLIGQDATATLTAITGLTPPSASAGFPAMNSGNGTITNLGNTVTLHNGTTVRGLSLNVTGTDKGLVAASRTGLTVSDITTISAGNNTAVDFSSSGGTFTFNNISTSGSGAGLLFASTTSGSTVNVNNVTTSSGAAVTLSSTGATNFSFNDVTSTTGSAVAINTATGALTFHAIAANGAAKGISVISATGSLTVNGTSTTDGTGGVVQNCTTRGAEFISSNNITLKNMNFTGNGTSVFSPNLACADGLNASISGTNTAANCQSNVHLQAVSAVTFTNLDVLNSKQIGINGNDVTNISMTNLLVTGNGDEVGEDGIQLANLKGASNSITNSTILNNAARSVEVQNNSAGATTINITGDGAGNNIFGNTTPPTSGTTPSTSTLGDTILMATNGTNSASLTSIIKGMKFTNLFGRAINSNTEGNTSQNVSFGQAGAGNGNTVQNVSYGTDINGTTSGSVTFSIVNNTFTNTPGSVSAGSRTVINARKGFGATGSWTGTVSGNTVGTAGSFPQSGCDAVSCGGISVDTAGTVGNFDVTITNNTIRHVNGQGIFVGNVPGSATTGTMRATITGNQLLEPDDGTAGAGGNQGDGINVTTSGTGGSINAKVGGSTAAEKNNVVGNWRTQSGQTIRGVRFVRGNGTTFCVSGFSGPFDSVSVGNYITTQNTGNAGSATQPVGQTGYSGPSCPTPLLLTQGGIEALFSTPSLLSSFVDSTFSVPIDHRNDALGSVIGAKTVSASVSQQQLDSIVAAAINRWATTGLTPQQMTTLRGIKFEIADLRGAYLGEANGNRILVDTNAEGKGWFVDANPLSDSSFAQAVSSTRRYTDPMNAAAGHVDLLTAIEHEIGHRLGLDDSYLEKDRDSIMYGYLTVGERRLPGFGQARYAGVSNQTKPHFLSLGSDSVVESPKSDERLTPLNVTTVGPISIGTLNPGKSVIIVYQATVNSPPLVRQVSTQGTVSGSNFSDVLTDDPEVGGTQATVTNINTTITWTGATDTNWNVATNWTVPGPVVSTYAPGVSNPAVNDVVIPNVGNQPTIGTTDIGIYSLNLSNGRTLTITNPRILTIGGSPGGDLKLDGIISGGELRFGTGTHAINNAGGTGSLSSTNLARVLTGSTTTLSNNLQAGALAVDAGGSLNITNRTLSLNGSGAALAVAGTFTTTGSTVVLNGTAAQTITGTIYNNLTINNTLGAHVTGVTLTGASATVNGVLTLTSSDLATGAFTLTMPVGATSAPASGASDVVGNVTRTGFVSGGSALSFGNPLNTIRINSGTAPTSINILLAKNAPATYAAAALRSYTITPIGGAGITATVRLHYRQVDLANPLAPGGSVSETPTGDFNFRRFTGGGWKAVVPTSRNVGVVEDNWLENSAVTTFSEWTFANLAPTASSGVVTGRIVDSNGAPVEGAVVRLEGTQNRKFITDANGIYRFENVETNGFYTVTPSRANYTFSPSVRSFSQLGETTEAAFGATVATSGFVNPLDTPEYFVRQHYVDFLGREPDEAGFNFWSDQIIGCGLDQDCIERKRENVSAAYFLSIEFQTTGGLVDGLYRASYGVRPNFAEFMPDTRAVAQGVVVGRDGWQSQLQANKEAFVAAFVNRPTFVAVYGNMDNSLFVDTLISHTGVSFTSSERDALVSGLTQGSMTRAEALSTIAENERFVSAKFNDTFVMMEYFGYLRRDADAAGFQYWLDKLNQFDGNFEQAQMVKAFIVSGEYRDRFPK